MLEVVDVNKQIAALKAAELRRVEREAKREAYANKLLRRCTGPDPVGLTATQFVCGVARNMIYIKGLVAAND